MRNIFRYCLLVLLLGLLSVNIASAKQRAIELFDDVRKSSGAELLGAADRAGYVLDGEERDVLVLLLEDELKRNWFLFNKDFVGQDLQQVMTDVFGNHFDAAKLEDVSDYNVKRVIRSVLDSGYGIEKKDGHFYPWPDYNYLFNTYAANTSPEIADYLSLRRMESGLLYADAVGSLSDRLNSQVDFIIALEEYLDKYPYAFRKAEVIDLYRELLARYLIKISYDPLMMDAGKIDTAVIDSYRVLARKQPSGKAGWFADRLAGEWEKREYVLDDHMHKILSDYASQIEIATVEKATGLYTNSYGLDLFKFAGSKRYLLLKDKKGFLATENQSITGKKDGYIVAQIKGVTVKTLPTDSNEIIYPFSFVVSQVVETRPWKFEADLFAMDFLAVGQEPFWTLRILTDDEVIFTTPAREQPYVFSYRPPQTGNCTEHSNECWHYVLQNEFALENDEMQVVITREDVRDSMTGMVYSYKAVVTLAGRSYLGAAFRPAERPVNPDKLVAETTS